MGKAAIQRRAKRSRYLAGLARNEPERFRREWEKRLASWIDEIRLNAGKLRDKEKHRVPAVFERLKEAMVILEGCGDEAFRRYAPYTYHLLATECCRQFAINVDPRLYRLNYYPRAA